MVGPSPASLEMVMETVWLLFVKFSSPDVNTLPASAFAFMRTFLPSFTVMVRLPVSAVPSYASAGSLNCSLPVRAPTAFSIYLNSVAIEGAFNAGSTKKAPVDTIGCDMYALMVALAVLVFSSAIQALLLFAGKNQYW